MPLFLRHREEPLVETHPLGQRAQGRFAALTLYQVVSRLRSRLDDVFSGRVVGVGDVGDVPTPEVHATELEQRLSLLAVGGEARETGLVALAALYGAHRQPALRGHDGAEGALGEGRDLLRVRARKQVEMVARAPQGDVLAHAFGDLPYRPALDGDDVALPVVVGDQEVVAAQGEADPA